MFEVTEMAAKAKQESKSGKEESFDAYFDMVQSRKKLPCALQEKLTSAFAKIPASSFPKVPGGKGSERLVLDASR